MSKEKIDVFTELAAIDVIAGKYGNGESRRKALGMYYDQVNDRVLEYYRVAHDVIAGKWGEGWNRQLALSGAGYDMETVERLVKELS